MTGDTSRRLVFGRDVPCPRCLGPRTPHVLGVEPHALRLWRRSPEDTKGREPTRLTAPCELCRGTGTIPT